MNRSFPLILLLLANSPTLAQSESLPPDPESVNPPSRAARVLGEPSAPIRIDIYSSFVCVECAGWWGTVLPEIRTRYIDPGQARMVFHDVAIEPIQHSVRASMIGLCSEPGRFYYVADAFMDGLAGARADTSTVGAWYDKAIQLSGRTPEEVADCTAQETVYEEVRSQNAAAASLGLTSFPAVMVNGRLVGDATAESIAAAILAASIQD